MIKPIIQQPSYPATRGNTGAGKRQANAHKPTTTRPPTADENSVPTPESLSMLIGRAIASLKQGVVWDRGSILNLNI